MRLFKLHRMVQEKRKSNEGNPWKGANYCRRPNFTPSAPSSNAWNSLELTWNCWSSKPFPPVAFQVASSHPQELLTWRSDLLPEKLKPQKRKLVKQAKHDREVQAAAGQVRWSSKQLLQAPTKLLQRPANFSFKTTKPSATEEVPTGSTDCMIPSLL